ncbi:hypothetical protein DCD74_02360 [Lysobacter oculi]|uniref:Uncharacterized protein n=1 Tax=Solilutibacter oculi TaxID=2698682 RepID=A0A344J3S6_9GAMM|nr:hypothetical protein [Lysobacter oculi]AXA83686.1 hypothetical protein DCD74_02360 [Lysobacter oculi]
MRDTNVTAEIRDVLAKATTPMTAVEVWDALVARDCYTPYGTIRSILSMGVKRGEFLQPKSRPGTFTANPDWIHPDRKLPAPRSSRPKPTLAMRVSALVEDLQEMQLEAANAGVCEDISMGIGSLLRGATRLRRELEC